MLTCIILLCSSFMECLSQVWDHTWPCEHREREEANFWQNWVRKISGPLHTSLLIILLFADNDRFDHYLYNGNSSNQEENLAGGMNYSSAGPTSLHRSDNSSQIWHLIMTKVSTHLAHLQSKP